MSALCAETRWQRVLRQSTLPAGSPVPTSGKPVSSAARTLFLCSGPTLEMLPRQLLLDTRLTPLERNAWLMLRLWLTTQPVLAARYEDLQPYLAGLPNGATASRETVARVLTVLRLSRWLSKVPRPAGRLYVVHDTPLSPAEAHALDPDYEPFLERCLSHAAKAIRLVAQHELATLQSPVSPAVDQRAERTLPTPLCHPIVAGPDRLKRPAAMDSAVIRFGESERGGQQASVEKSPHSHAVRNPNPARTVLNTHTTLCISTTPRAPNSPDPVPLRWPEALHLTARERHAAAQALDALAPDARQSVLDECQARCAAGGIRQPAAYLMGLIRRARQGDFRPWAALHSERPAVALIELPRAEREAPTPAPRAPDQPLSAVVQHCLEELRGLTQPRRSA